MLHACVESAYYILTFVPHKHIHILASVSQPASQPTMLSKMHANHNISKMPVIDVYKQIKNSDAKSMRIRKKNPSKIKRKWRKLCFNERESFIHRKNYEDICNLEDFQIHSLHIDVIFRRELNQYISSSCIKIKMIKWWFHQMSRDIPKRTNERTTRSIQNSKVHLKIMILSNQRHLSSLVNHLNSVYATEFSVSASTFLNYRNILDLPFSHIIASPRHTICVQEIANSFMFFVFHIFWYSVFVRRVLAVSNLVYENDTRWMLKNKKILTSSDEPIQCMQKVNKHTEKQTRTVSARME